MAAAAALSPGSLTEMAEDMPRPIQADSGQVIALRGAGDFVGARTLLGVAHTVLEHKSNLWRLTARTGHIARDRVQAML